MPDRPNSLRAPAATFAGAAALVLAVVLAAPAAQAQGWQNPPGGDGRNPICQRLEAQLASLDRGGGDGRADQIRRYEEAASRQQAELDRIEQQSRRLGCDSGGFFLFRGAQNPQCDPLAGQIRQMRTNLDQMRAGLNRLQGSGGYQDEQRRSILLSLGQSNCGPQYRAAIQQPQRQGLFDSLFGPSESTDNGVMAEPQPAAPSGAYRTVCVRTCDGYYFPISYSTSPSRFPEDERTCQRTCPAAEVALYAHRTTGENMSQAVSIQGQPYSSLPNAFRYRQEINPACSCKRAGESWANAMGTTDETVQRGDIVVTDERARALSQPRQDPPPRQQQQRRNSQQQQPAAQAPRQQAAPQQRPLPPPGTQPPPAQQPADAPRSVGTPFYR